MSNINEKSIESIKKQIIDSIKNSSKEISPFLVVSMNKNFLEIEVKKLLMEIFEEFNVDKNQVFELSKDKEKISIEDTREFIKKWAIKASFWFQFFLINDISRINKESSNALLKFLEEPWEGNIIIITNSNQNQILETILSRVKTYFIWWNSDYRDEFYIDLIWKFIEKKDNSLISYIYKTKLEKQEYEKIMKNFIIYFKENFVFLEKIDMIEESIRWLKNNVSWKYAIDNIISKLI